MARAIVIEGTAREIQDHLKTIDENAFLTLIVTPPIRDGGLHVNLHHASPDVRARALNQVAAMNKNVPVLAAEAYNRESLYE